MGACVGLADGAAPLVGRGDVALLRPRLEECVEVEALVVQTGAATDGGVADLRRAERIAQVDCEGALYHDHIVVVVDGAVRELPLDVVEYLRCRHGLFLAALLDPCI